LATIPLAPDQIHSSYVTTMNFEDRRQGDTSALGVQLSFADISRLYLISRPVNIRHHHINATSTSSSARGI